MARTTVSALIRLITSVNKLFSFLLRCPDTTKNVIDSPCHQKFHNGQSVCLPCAAFFNILSIHHPQHPWGRWDRGGWGLISIYYTATTLPHLSLIQTMSTHLRLFGHFSTLLLHLLLHNIITQQWQNFRWIFCWCFPAEKNLPVDLWLMIIITSLFCSSFGQKNSYR